MRRRLTAALLALLMTFGLTSCKDEENTEIPYTLEEVLTAFASSTELDEVMTYGASIEISETTSDKTTTYEMDFMDSVNKLEDYIALINELKALGIEPSETSTPDTINKYSNLTLEEVELLVDSLDSELTDVEEARIRAGLAYVSNSYQQWIKENGLAISEELLLRLVKASICDASGLEPMYFTSCTINPQGTTTDKSKSATVKLTDPISGKTLDYDITNQKDDPLQIAVTTLYNIQSLDENVSYETIVTYCNDTLLTTKLAVAAGVELSNDTIYSDEKTKDAKKKILDMSKKSTN